MRFLPYVLVGFMALPIVIWTLINTLVVKSSTSAFSTGDVAVLGSLGVFVALSFVLLPRWIVGVMKRTGG
ncbi:hypothetical protein GALL_201090 [mine drainage metagenome]|uniref:Uncharacterized protein n=1 Tax=mine drainage metagenome TaxID=410659 RepID=A0A1J5S1A1_9ZZZZ